MIPWEVRLNDSPGSVVAAAGTWSGNTPRIEGSLVGIRCRPATSTTIYDLKVVEYDSFVVYERKGIKGAIVEDMNIPTAVRGILTVTISNSTANEAFTLKLMVG